MSTAEQRVMWRERQRRYVARHGPQVRSQTHRSYTHQRAIDKRLRAHFLHLGIPCMECGGRDRLEVSHIIPVIDGGGEQMVQWLCHECHVNYDNAPVVAT